MAKITKPPIPLKMYKHFAVTTVSLTAAIAMFADSDNRDAMAEHIEEQQEQAELRRASAERFGAPRLVRNDSQNGSGSFGSEGAIAPAPAGGGGGWGGGSGSRGSSTGGGFGSQSGRVQIAGYDQDFIDGLSEEEYRSFLDALPEEAREAADPRARAEQRAALERASAQRSGRRGPSADAPR